MSSRRLHFVAFAAALLVLPGFQSLSAKTRPTTGKPAVVKPAAVPADDTLNATAWSQSSAEHDQVYRQIYRAAGAQLDAAIADRAWDAMPRGERDNDPAALTKLAIIVDIDETVLDNSPYQARRIAAGDDDVSGARWNAWVAQPLAGKPGAKALPGAAEFVRAAGERGVTVFYISNREAASAEATLKALQQAGFPAQPGQFLGKGTVADGCVPSNPSDKMCRRRLVAREHRVLMLFGDQLTDFISIAAPPEERKRQAQGYADWFGQRWWMLPNPMYGSWESATWQGQKNPGRDDKRKAKRAVLDTAEQARP